MAAKWIRSGVPFATAKLVSVQGSSPRELGATMIVDADGHVFGNVSGGCVESALLIECERAIDSGEASTHRYGISDDVFAIGLTCGGVIEVLVSPVLPDSDAARQLLRACESEPERPRLIVVGAVEHAAALVRLGGTLGYAATVVDPRPVFATQERFPGADVVVQWPGRYLAHTPIDARTAICVLSHDPRLDVPAIQVALTRDAGYVGAMGSRRTHEDRLRRLAQAGVPAADIARLRSPIGLHLGGRTPEETALSILAEIVAVRHDASGIPLSRRQGPVHAPSGPCVGGVVLAAGAGTRFGGPKALAHQPDGTPWVELAVRALDEGGCAPILVVLGASHDDAQPLVPPPACTVVAEKWDHGLGESLRTALGWLADSDAQAMLVTTVDTPELPASACARLMQGASSSSLSRAVYRGRPGHPALIGREHWAPLARSVSGDAGAGRYLRQAGALEIECADLWHGRDIDAPLAGRPGTPVTRR